MGRADEREGIDPVHRIRLLEGDMDRMEGRSGKIVALLLGIGASLVTACVLLAINLGVVS